MFNGHVHCQNATYIRLGMQFANRSFVECIRALSYSHFDVYLVPVAVKISNCEQFI
ncbi:hypothetical protein HanRHA438_Chr10g0459421 [Helianthus annuus]|nr:hypothetical protein HanRHA438_Chr10g0459421 [Helianthus annuus]